MRWIGLVVLLVLADSARAAPCSHTCDAKDMDENGCCTQRPAAPSVEARLISELETISADKMPCEKLADDAAAALGKLTRTTHHHHQTARGRDALGLDARRRIAKAAGALLQIASNRCKTLDAKRVRKLGLQLVIAAEQQLAYDPSPVPTTIAPVPARELAAFASFDFYRRVADAKESADELLEITLLRAAVHRRYRHDADALPLYAEIILSSPRHALAISAIDQSIEVYRLIQPDGLIGFVDKLLAEPKLFEGRLDLEDRLKQVRRSTRRRE